MQGNLVRPEHFLRITIVRFRLIRHHNPTPDKLGQDVNTNNIQFKLTRKLDPAMNALPVLV